jgi:hypothetical protein
MKALNLDVCLSHVFVSQGSFKEITGDRMIMGNHRYGARFGTAVANVGDLNMDGYEGKQYKYK